jgi:hypothetical protein
VEGHPLGPRRARRYTPQRLHEGRLYIPRATHVPWPGKEDIRCLAGGPGLRVADQYLLVADGKRDESMPTTTAVDEVEEELTTTQQMAQTSGCSKDPMPHPHHWPSGPRRARRGTPQRPLGMRASSWFFLGIR